MKRQELKDLIRDKFKNSAKTDVQSWVLSDDFEKELEEFIDEDLDHGLVTEQDFDINLEHLADKIIKESKNKSKLRNLEIDEYKELLEKNRSWRNAFKIAAALLFVALFAFATIYFVNNQPQGDNQITFISKENPRGRKSTVFLKEGTAVNLNAESKITFPQNFNDSIREVWLQGEAFFDVVRDEQRPMIVHIGELDVIVLGTSFNINGHDEEFVKISLSSGLVELSANGTEGKTSLSLSPGESTFFLTQQNSFTDVTLFDHNLDLGWKEGVIVFKEADMTTMISTFQRWFDVDIELKNQPYFAWDYTGQFKKQTLQDIMESLSFSQSFDFEIADDKVTIEFKPN